LPAIQAAIDRFIVAPSKPEMERDGGTLRKLIFERQPPLVTAAAAS
jgi:hypothetical protein